MRSVRGASALLLAFALVASFVFAVVTPAAASPADEYTGPYFGAGNLPPGCENDVLVGELTLKSFSSYQDPKSLKNICHHMRTGLNGLDSPQVDVLVMVPVSPTAERDMRIMRQSIEMWEGGIDYLAEEMGLGWLATGMDFHITVDYFDPTGDGGGEFTTYPVVDPEIVVIATNPVGGIGIGIDPLRSGLPCHPVANPFDFAQWEALPGFNSHHDGRTGTYNEDCGGQGGNVCFAINGAIDPAPESFDFFGLFDLVSHEFGHCLTIGHVGDGAEGRWGAVPTNDIMAYDSDPPGLTKCVSTLDVESVATRMSNYLDVNGDGAVTSSDVRVTNDQVGEGSSPFQVQHPYDHLYASSTGDPTDCPQPDLAAVPAAQPTDWTPAPVATTGPDRSIVEPTDPSPEPPSGDPAPTGTSPRTSTDESAPTGTSPGTAPSGQTSGPSDPSDGSETNREPPTPDAALTRVEGNDRIDTAVSASRFAFGDGAAGAVVLARADQFADGLAGTSLAVSSGAPALLTASSGLDARVAQEIQRVLPQGRQIFVLGGPAALTGAMDPQLESMGYSVVRLAGADRFETSVRVAMAQPRPESILLATGQNFADALAAGAAAAEADGLVLLTDDGSLPPSVADYLARNGDIPRVAIGGPAALAAPGAERLVGADRFETAVIVARRFFSSSSVVGLASGVSFADALSGGALLGHVGGPLVLTAPTQLSPVVSDYLSGESSIDDLFVIGGESAVAPAVVDEARQALGG